MFRDWTHSSNDSRDSSPARQNFSNILTTPKVSSSTRTNNLSSNVPPKMVIPIERANEDYHNNHTNLDENNFFQSKTACVTGAGRGIGRAVALRLAQAGCSRVIALGKTEAHLFSLSNEHKNIIPIAVDVSHWVTTKAAIQPYLPIQLLVNNAGVLILNDFHDIHQKDFDISFQTNVRPIIGLTQEITRDLIARNLPGSIVNVSSIASAIAAQKFMVYAGTKACMDAFTRNMANELGPHQIRVNSVQPTVVLTDMGKAAGWENEQQAAPLLAKTPLGRFAELDDVVEPILFLLSNKSSMITGTCLPIDGVYKSYFVSSVFNRFIRPVQLKLQDHQAHASPACLPPPPPCNESYQMIVLTGGLVYGIPNPANRTTKHVYKPQRMDVITAAEKVLTMMEPSKTASFIESNRNHGLKILEISVRDQVIIPGLIDVHVHAIGGGGEQGPYSRTPESRLSHLINGGLTTIVGILGTDGMTRSLSSLLQKMKSLEHDG
ncbi:unnamed protein product, partial [Rotaria sordida]